MALPPFQSLLDDHREDVFGFLVAAVGRSEAEDCFQETFLAAMRAYPRLRDASNLRGWLLTIAHRKAIDAHRARRRRPSPVGGLPERSDDGIPGSEPALWARVRELPPKQRDAVLHRFVSDLSFREIGRVMNCSEDAARQSVHQGLKRLREVWT